jgi:hypothetical protein
MITSKAHALVEVDAQPTERFQDIFLGTWHETVGIGILDTEHHVTAMLTGEKIIIQSGTHTTYM